MRLAVLGLLALMFALPSQAQQVLREQAPRPGLRSTFVVPAHRGEARRITTYARRPPEQGRLSRRYRGLRANRTAPAHNGRVGFVPLPVRQPRVLQRTTRTPRHEFVRRGGSHYQVVRRR